MCGEPGIRHATEDSKPEWTLFRHPVTLENSEIGPSKQREPPPKGKGGFDSWQKLEEVKVYTPTCALVTCL